MISLQVFLWRKVLQCTIIDSTLAARTRADKEYQCDAAGSGLLAKGETALNHEPSTGNNGNPS